MKRTLLIVALGITAVGLLAGFGFGAGHAMMDPVKMEKFITWRINDLLDDIQATPTQRAAVLAVKDRLLPEFRQLPAQRDATHAQLQEMWKSDSPDPKAVHALVDQRLDEFRSLAHKVADGFLDIHKALTPAQRAQLAAQAEKEHGNWHP